MTHNTTIKYQGKTIFESNYGLGAKHGWVFFCDCGDTDSTGYKTDIIEIAKEHAEDIILTVINKNGEYAKGYHVPEAPAYINPIERYARENA